MKKTIRAIDSRFSEKAQSLFAEYPKAKEVFFAADGTAFFDNAQATLHAKGLQEKTVINIKREEYVTKS